MQLGSGSSAMKALCNVTSSFQLGNIYSYYKKHSRISYKKIVVMKNLASLEDAAPCNHCLMVSARQVETIICTHGYTL